MPDAERLHKASKLAGRVAVYTQRTRRSSRRGTGVVRLHRDLDL